MKTATKHLLLNIILILIIILALLFLRKYQSNFNLISDIHWGYFVVLSLFSWLTAFVNGWRIKIYLKIFETNLQFKEWFGLSQITSMMNYITPFKGGAFIRAWYLNTKHNFPYEKFIVTAGATALISFFGYSLVGILSTFSSLILTQEWNLTLLAIFVIIFLGTLVVFFFPLEFIQELPWHNFLVNKLKSMVEGWYLIKEKPKNIFYLSSIEVAFIIVYSFSLFFGFAAVGAKIPYLYCLIIALISTLSVIFTITPAGIGVREAVIVWASHLLTPGMVVPLNVAVILRLVAMFWGIPIGMIFSYILIKDEKKEVEKSAKIA